MISIIPCLWVIERIQILYHLTSLIQLHVGQRDDTNIYNLTSITQLCVGHWQDMLMFMLYRHLYSTLSRILPSSSGLFIWNKYISFDFNNQPTRGQWVCIRIYELPSITQLIVDHWQDMLMFMFYIHLISKQCRILP